jgi:hypothetical protein
LSLSIGRERCGSSCATHTESDDLAPSLACLDVTSEGLTVGQISSGENAFICTAGL